MDFNGDWVVIGGDWRWLALAPWRPRTRSPRRFHESRFWVNSKNCPDLNLYSFKRGEAMGAWGRGQAAWRAGWAGGRRHGSEARGAAHVPPF